MLSISDVWSAANSSLPSCASLLKIAYWCHLPLHSKHGCYGHKLTWDFVRWGNSRVSGLPGGENHMIPWPFLFTWYQLVWCHSMLVKQPSSFSRKHRILSLQICGHRTVQTETRMTSKFWDWCQKRMYKTPVCDTSNLKHRLINTMLKHIIDKAVGQWRKWSCASTKVKGHHFESKLKPALQSHHPTYLAPPTVYRGK